MGENKITESMLKRALKEKHEISSIGAIILFIVLSMLLGVVGYLLIELFFSILKAVPTDVRTNILNVIGNVVEFKGFYIISSVIISIILVAIYIKIMNHNFILTSKKQDLIQKFIIMILALTMLTVLVNLYSGRKKMHSQFLTLEILQYADCSSFVHNPELYEQYHKDDKNKFSNIGEIREYYIQQYESSVDSYIVDDNVKAIIESCVLIIITSIGIVFIKKNN